jgi:hypothetical protein
VLGHFDGEPDRLTSDGLEWLEAERVMQWFARALHDAVARS